VLTRPLDLLAPPLCWACRAPAARGSALCRGCRASLRFLGEHVEFLPHSGRNSTSAVPGHADRAARAAPLVPAEATAPPVCAAVAYEGAARELVKALKFHGATAVADEMAALLIANAPRGLLAGSPTAGGAGPAAGGAGSSEGAGSSAEGAGPSAAALVPVPLHPARERARGFNQAERLAAAVAVRTGLPLSDCLVRAGPATRQVGRNRSARLRGPPGSIRATGPAPATAVLIDDVVTTGATLAACAAALRAAGSADVVGLVFARTTGR
jgi:predicted amidophosphoribosyltransferase